MEDETYILCPQLFSPGAHPDTTSKVVECTKCHAKAWLGPSNFERARTIPILCDECALALADSGEPIEFVAAPETVAAISKRRGRPMTAEELIREQEHLFAARRKS